MIFLFVVLAAAGFALAGFAGGESGSGTETTQVIESSSDPFDAGLPEAAPVEDSGTAYGVVEEPTSEATATTPTTSPSPSPSLTRRAPRQQPVSAMDSTRSEARDRPQTADPTPAVTTDPAPQRTTPPPPPPPATTPPSSPQPEPGLLERLFG
jgi:hypothetical protein